jgi:hypothetical protein
MHECCMNGERGENTERQLCPRTTTNDERFVSLCATWLAHFCYYCYDGDDLLVYRLVSLPFPSPFESN